MAMRSEGSRLLGAVDMTQRQIAGRIGVGRATVAMWISGQRVPDRDNRRALLAAFSIPPTAWPGEWTLVRDILVRTLAEKAPHLLEEIAEQLERLDVTMR